MNNSQCQIWCIIVLILIQAEGRPVASFRVMNHTHLFTSGKCIFLLFNQESPMEIILKTCCSLCSVKTSMKWTENTKSLYVTRLQSGMFLTDDSLAETSIFSSRWKVTGRAWHSKMFGDWKRACLHLVFTRWQPCWPYSSNQSQKNSPFSEWLLITFWYKDTPLCLINSSSPHIHSYPQCVQVPAGIIDMRANACIFAIVLKNQFILT